MTTNQTIDGVPLELLERIAAPMSSCQNSKHHLDAVDELRALLDAPAPRAEFKKVEMAHVMNALEDVRGKPVLTSNQCHDLARALNDRLLSPLQLLAMPAGYLAAAQPQGEPVAKCSGCNGKGSVCIDWDCGEWMDCPDCKAPADAEGYPDDPLGTIYGDEQPAPVAVVLPVRADARNGSHDHQSGWNACLDEVTRLNTASR